MRPTSSPSAAPSSIRSLSKNPISAATRGSRHAKKFFTDPGKDPSTFEKTIRAGRPQHPVIAWSHSHGVRARRPMVQAQRTHATGFGTETIDAGYRTKRTQLRWSSFLVDRLEFRIRLPLHSR